MRRGGVLAVCISKVRTVVLIARNSNPIAKHIGLEDVRTRNLSLPLFLG